MFRSFLRLALALAVMAAALAVGLTEGKAQQDDFRRFFRKPSTPLEFFKALEFELEVGRPDLAAAHLRGLIDSKPTDKDYYAVVDAVGLTPILRLRNRNTWDEKNDKANKQALDDVKTLIEQVTAANNRRLKDRDRINELINQLKKTEEEKVYALRELYKSGTEAVVPLIESLSRAADAADRVVLLEALEAMGNEALAPMIAALGSPNKRLKLDLLDIIRRKHAAYAEQITPHLYYPSASPDEDIDVRKKARKLQADFLKLPESRLPAAKVALTREAERFYTREARVGDPKGVTVWRWDGKTVVRGWPGAETISPDQANEYWGLRFARQALNLDPSYRPAQSAFLGLAIQSRPGAPETNELVAKASVELLQELLERGLKEQRRPEVVNMLTTVIRALGDRAEVRAKKPGGQGDSALVRALYYPDPRVQFEAVQTLLLIPGPPAPKTSLRIVEILGRQLTPMATQEIGSKVLVAIADEGWRTKVVDAVNVPEFRTARAIAASTGRDAMRKLRAHADIDAILLDSSLPDPDMAHLLAQVRADVDVGRVPILLAAVPQTRSALELQRCWQRLQDRLEVLNAETRVYRSVLQEIADDEAKQIKELKDNKRLTPDDRTQGERAIREKGDERRGVADNSYLNASVLSKDVPKLIAKQDRIVYRYDLESKLRETQLERFVSRYPNVYVVHPTVLTDAKSLYTTVSAAVRQADVAIQDKQRNENAETAAILLSGLAQGKPAGYDIRPAADIILETIRQGKVSANAQRELIYTAARLPGERPQAEFLAVLMDAARPAGVRQAGAEGLIQHVQRYGVLMTANQVAPIYDLARDPKLDPELKKQVNFAIGALKPCEKGTGKMLRKYDPTPVAPLPPPKDDKEKGEK